MQSGHSGKCVFTRVHVVKEGFTEEIGWKGTYDSGVHIMAPPLNPLYDLGQVTSPN